MVVVVEFAFKSVQHVVDLGKPGFFQRTAGIERAVAAAADHHDGPVDAGRLFDVGDKMRVDVPVGAIVPGDVDRADRMADEQIFHFAAAVDEYRVPVLLEELSGLFGF